MVLMPMGDIPRFHRDRKAPDAVALSYPNAALTWSELEDRANQRARLYESLGVQAGDMVGVALENTTHFHEAAFALWKLGATPALLSPRSSSREFQALIELIGPKLLLAPPDVAAWAGTRGGVGDADLSGFSAVAAQSAVGASWKAVCSGGSTGRPKVIVDHGPAAYDPTTDAADSVFRMRRDGVVLNPGPLYHNAPFLFSNTALFTGSTVVGMERFDAEEALRLIEAHRVNWVCLVPTMMNRIWSLPQHVRDRYDLSSLDAVWHMAAACPAWLKQAWIDWLGAERIWELYGGTEGYGRTCIRGDDWLTHRGSVGRAAGGAQVRAFREDGQACATGEVGELYFLPENREPSHYVGAEAKRTADGWYSIGDLGSLDDEGYVYLADRRTDLIIRGGANIYPAEVEAVLDEHPAIGSSIVVGLPCDDLGARVHAILELRGDARDLRELPAFLASRLAKYKLPETYEVTSVALRDDAGKARRSALRDERIAWMGEGRPFRKAGAELGAPADAHPQSAST